MKSIFSQKYISFWIISYIVDILCMYIFQDVESNTEQTAEEEQGDSNSGFNEHLKENKAAGEIPLQGCFYWSWVDLNIM